MQPASMLLTLLGLSTYTSASSLQINNYCTDSLWTTLTSPSEPFAEPFEIPSGVANISDISGSGNSLGVTFSKDYYAENTPKLVLGFTSVNGRLWWSLGDISGDPFKGKAFNVTTPDHDGKDVCGDAVGLDGENHNCEEGDFTLTFNPCFE
ncbi:hypothetical protein TI39_contig4159g00066 [Zymoseptoria brevis]|uniref:Bys1 family protein n=1 Tax=Zymoseptoria brevis TaxID=1047168 RepID=A0A0F4GBK5_9PEZI|nr:hypothetical protein TI39_contig4159g00066 [Zymoseptoria brevis]